MEKYIYKKKKKKNHLTFWNSLNVNINLYVLRHKIFVRIFVWVRCCCWFDSLAAGAELRVWYAATTYTTASSYKGVVLLWDKVMKMSAASDVSWRTAFEVPTPGNLSLATSCPFLYKYYIIIIYFFYIYYISLLDCCHAWAVLAPPWTISFFFFLSALYRSDSMLDKSISLLTYKDSWPRVTFFPNTL